MSTIDHFSPLLVLTCHACTVKASDLYQNGTQERWESCVLLRKKRCVYGSTSCCNIYNCSTCKTFDVWILAQCTTVGVLLTDWMIMGCTVRDAHEQRGTSVLEVYSGFRISQCCMPKHSTFLDETNELAMQCQLSDHLWSCMWLAASQTGTCFALFKKAQQTRYQAWEINLTNNINTATVLRIKIASATRMSLAISPLFLTDLHNTTFLESITSYTAITVPHVLSVCRTGFKMVPDLLFHHTTDRATQFTLKDQSGTQRKDGCWWTLVMFNMTWMNVQLTFQQWHDC